MAFKVFLDTNILLDHLFDRNLHSSRILKACEAGFVQGYASSASFYTLVYLIRKQVPATEARRLLGAYLTFIEILPTRKVELRLSLDSSFNDLEDSFQYFTAIQNQKLDFFITNNLKDFQNASQQLPVINAEKFALEHLS